jgi:CheY-like chemotaxis protein
MAETITSIASLLWPLLALVALTIFRQPLQRVVQSAEKREWRLEIGGQKLSMSQLSDQQNAMIADLQLQIGALNQKLSTLTAGMAPEIGDLDEHTEQAPGYAQPRDSQANWQTSNATTPRSVLWVDDAPENNAIFIDQLQRADVRVDLARSTGEGLALLGKRQYGIVLSDMGRAEDGSYVSDAGLRLLREVRATDPATPFVIYSSAKSTMLYREQALAEGATDMTTSPVDLSEHLQALGLLI